jgi:hypothetical protein
MSTSLLAALGLKRAKRDAQPEDAAGAVPAGASPPAGQIKAVLDAPKRMLRSIAVMPERMTLSSASRARRRQQFKATGTFFDGHQRDITKEVAWTSSMSVLLSIDATGMAEVGIGEGTATISARDSKSGIASPGVSVTVETPVLASIDIEPAQPSIDAHGELKFVAWGIYSDTSRADVSGTIAWSSSVPAVISIDAKGLASTSHRGGVADIKATDPKNSRVWAATTVTVKERGHPERLDLSKVKVGDLSDLRDRMKRLTPDVQAVRQAETAMNDAAKGNRIDLDHPQRAQAGIKLDERDVESLTNALGLAANTRSDMKNIGHQIQHDLDRTRVYVKLLKKRQPQPLDESFYNELDKERSSVWLHVQHALDGAAQVTKAIQDLVKDQTLNELSEKAGVSAGGTPPWLTALVMGAVLGASVDIVKDGIKALDQPFDPTEHLRSLGRGFDRIVTYLDQQNAGELVALQVHLFRLRDDYATKSTEYESNLDAVGAVLSRLAARRGTAVGPGFAKTYEAVLRATGKSKIARGQVDDEMLEWFKRLLPPGELIRELPKSDGWLLTESVVYEKGGQQYAYRNESVASIQDLVQQLEAVRQLEASGQILDRRLAAWTQAITAK